MKKRIIATILSIALMITQVPWAGLDAFAASQEQTTASLAASAGETYVSDNDTFDSWKDEFSPTDTEFAGAIWTDKSVFESDELGTDFGNLKLVEFDGIDADGNIKMKTETGTSVSAESDNFVVAMSALGSTKEITGYSVLPSDTVFVLDVSNSMSDTDLAKMVEATNKAIEKLQNLNRHNRVAVVVYGYDGAVLLDIDRYATTKTATDSTGASYPVYIELNNDYSQIRTARSRKTSAGNSVNINNIDFDAIVNDSDMPKWNYSTMDDYYYDYDRYLDAVAVYLERDDVLGTARIGVDINWSRAVENKSNSQTWQTFLYNRVQQAINNQQGQQQNRETSDLTDGDGNYVTASVTASGATYIQGGMYAAERLFNDIYTENDTAIETGLIQGGTARLPITVLMSDGAPTYGATNYTEAIVNNRVLGDGSSNSVSDYLVFPAQLTAAHLSKMMETYYGREALIYTLGLGIEHDEARRVLNPSNYTSTNLNTWWTNYGTTAQNSAISGYSYGNRYITRAEGAVDANGNSVSLTDYRYYVDQYFDAESSAELVAAFDEIVEAIILQSRYYPTLVESGKHDLDGYITFEDEIGGYVEVKEIKGMLLGGELYTGAALIEAINTQGVFGNASTYTDYGNELVVSISERLDIDQAKARTLLSSAWRSSDGQLTTKNFIGWYGDGTNNYLGHWDTNHTGTNYPEDAKYLNKCYIFQGDLSDTYSSLAGTDMMHIVVQVHEEIETGHQCVIWKIPASLVPLVTYTVSVEGNQLVDGMPATLTTNIDEVSPISLLYEVGLVDTLNEVNLMSEVAKTGHVKDEHRIVDSNGNTIGYAFYSNRWGAQHTNDGSGATDIFDNGNMATVSHFVPSKENERYYYTEDTIIYIDQNGTAYTGSSAPATTGTYWHPYSVIGNHGTSGNTSVHTHYLPVSAAALAQAQPLDDGTGRWYIPAGIIHQAIDDYIVYKDGANAQSAVGGLTGTMPYAVNPYIKDLTDIYDFLGNNGRWMMYSATGLAITKTIEDAAVAVGSVDFEFVVELTNKTEVPQGVKVVDIDGNAIPASNSGNKITVTVKNGQTAYIVGLEAGTEYTVKESYNANYVVSSATGETVTGTGKNTVVSGTVEQYVVDSAEFINKHSTHKGNLVVSKTITHPYSADYIIPVNDNTVFKVDVALDANDFTWGADEHTKTFSATGTVKYKDSGNYVTGILKAVTYSKDAGKVTSVTLVNDTVLNDNSWWLGHDDSFTILELPEDVDYTVTEVLTDHNGFEQDAENSKNLAGTILSDETVSAELVNKYTPAPATSAGLKAQITKKLEGRQWQAGDSFSFFLQKYDTSSSTWQNVSVGGTEVALTIETGANAGGYERTSSPNTATISFTKDDIGTNYFRIGETAGTLTGITYDSTYRYYSVTVSDEDMDGDIDVSVANYQGVTVTSQGEDTYLLEVTFTNHYAQAVANISLHKTLTNDTGIDVSMDEFEFEFCTLQGCTKDTNCPNAAKHLTLKANANGDLTFPQVYVESDLSDVTQWTYTTTETVMIAANEGGEGTGEGAAEGAEGNANDGEAAGEGATGGEPAMQAVEQTVTKTAVEGVDTIPEGAQKSKTFTYYLWEKAGSIPGMNYDSTVYKVDVVVTVTKASPSNTIAVTGTTVTAVSGTSAAVNNVAQFSNTYKVDPVPVQTTITGTKNLTGRNIIANEFEFELYKADSSFAKVQLLETQTTDEGGSTTEQFAFKLPTEADGKYSKAGTYYYVIDEKAKDNAAITYDDSVYHITVVVGLVDGTNDLEVKSVLINKVGGASGPDIPVEFNNSYTILSGTSITVNGDKDVTGKDVLVQDEFTFGVYSDAVCTVPVYVDANGYVVDASAAEKTALTAKSAAVSGAFSFTVNYAQTGTFTYYLKEETPANSYGGTMTADPVVYKIVVTVADDGHVNGTTAGDGELEASYVVTKADGSAAESIKFTNRFVPDIVSARTVLGTKIYADNSNAPINVNNWQGTFNFALYKSDKDFNTQGENALTQTVPNGKTYTGTYNKTTGKFDTNVNLTDYTADDGDSINNKQQFGLDLKFTEAGAYYYILKEVPGTDSNVHFDTAEYYVTYLVTEAADGSGALNAAVSVVYGGNTVQNSEFRNYKIKKYVDVQVKLTKDIDNISTVSIPMSTFQFGLYTNADCTTPVTVDGAPLVSYASTHGDASFNFQFDNVTHTITDNTPYKVTYYAKEIVPAAADRIEGMTYDESVYKVEIIVEVDKQDKDGDGDRTELDGYDILTQIVDKDGNPIAQVNQTAEADNEATFTNKYEIDDAKLVIDGTKTVDGRDMTQADVFEFGLYNAVLSSGEETGWSAGELVGENFVVNNNGAAFVFPEISYNAEGIHYYVVKETVPAAGTGLDNITYDTTEFLIKVVVTNGNNGSFVATDSVVSKKVGSVYTAATNENPLDIAFTNVFTPEPIDVKIEGTKSYNGTLTDGQFTFELYKADEHYNETGAAIATVTNNANGEFEFTAEDATDDVNDAFTSELTFSEAGTYHFIVVEKAGNDPTVKYDTKEYNIEVKVTKDNTGTLSEAITVTNREAGETGLVIKNTYTQKTANTSVNVKKTLTNNTGVNPGVTVSDFEFKLYTDENCNNPVAASDANVSVSTFNPRANGEYGIGFNYTDADFNLTDYTQTKTYTYYLRETKGSVSGMDYDKSVYKIEIALKYNGTTLTATPTVTKIKDAAGAAIANPTPVTTASFNNVYDLGTANVSITGTKVFTGWADGDEFTFELYQTDSVGNYAAADSVRVGTHTVTYSDRNNGFSFTPETVVDTASNTVKELVFNKAGTYYFVVREYKGGLTDTTKEIVYDGTQYVVTVTVTPDSTTAPTKLVATKAVHVYGHTNTVNEIIFTNTDLKGKTTVDIIGKKVLAGRDIAEQEFDFEIYEANEYWTYDAEKPLFSIENRQDAADQKYDGYNIEFIGVPLEYTNDGDHIYHFVVKEANSGHPTISYDATEYRIEITGAFSTVTNNNITTHPYTINTVKITDANGNPAGSYVNNQYIVLDKDGTGAGDVSFSNIYTSLEATTAIAVDKNITTTTGVSRGDEFEFGLYTNEACTSKLYVDASGNTVTVADGAAVPAGVTHATIKATAATNGSITLRYTDKDVKTTPHVYYLKEIVPAENDKIPGMTYSSEVYKVEVMVEFGKDGQNNIVKVTPTVTAMNASGVSAQATGTTAAITNSYVLNPATLVLSGQKILPEHEIRKDDFTFVLYEAMIDQSQLQLDSNGKWKLGRQLDTAYNSGKTAGAATNDFDLFTFDQLTFDKAGTYHYIVEETKATLRGVTYDADRYQVTVVVENDDKDSIDDGTPNVWNELVVKSVTYERVNYKYENNARVLDGSNEAATEITFTNHYTAKGSFSIGGTKEIIKRAWRNGDSFTFELYAATVDAQGEWTVGNKVAEDTVDYADAVKEFVFSNIEVSDSLAADTSTGTKVAQIGTHYFVIKEKDNGDTNTTAVDYDDVVYRVVVNTKDNGDGSLTVGKYDEVANVFTADEFVVTKVDGTTEIVLGTADPITFVNEYFTKDATAKISGTKAIDNADIKDYKGQFTFELYTADSSWTVDNTVAPVTTTNNLENGSKFEFSNIPELTFDQAGTYCFIVKEQKGTNPIVKYDTTEYKVKVEVTDTGVVNGEAQLSAAVDVLAFTSNGDEVVEFTNSYNPADVTINIKKALSFTNGAAHTLGGFKFKIEGVGNSTLLEATSGNDGTIAVPLSYTENDLGAGYAPKTYTYKISEINTGIDSMTYDTTEYIIEVEVYAENGELKTAITQQNVLIGANVNATEVNFNNIYRGPDPVPDPKDDPGRIVNTGDIRNNMLYAGLMASSAAGLIAVLFLMKKKKDEEDEAEA